jgi:hypothetical protein
LKISKTGKAAIAEALDHMEAEIAAIRIQLDDAADRQLEKQDEKPKRKS